MAPLIEDEEMDGDTVEQAPIAGELWSHNIDAKPLPSYASARIREDDRSQKARTERLGQLLRVACSRVPGDLAEETETNGKEELDSLLCGGELGNASVLRSVMQRLGLDCRREPSARAIMKRRLKELKLRRDAASHLIDEMEREVLVLSNELTQQATELTKLSSSTGASAHLQHVEGEKFCLTDLLTYGSPCAATSRMSRVEGLEPPELRCQLRQQLHEAEQELCDLRTEVCAARQMGTTAWQNVKQVLLDTQPEASLLDGRRALLAFARGKARGTSIAERLLHWDVQRKLLQAAIFGWRTVLHAHRHVDRMQVFLGSRVKSDMAEACFSLWRQVVDRQWSRLAERRISRSEEILLRLSVRFLAGGTHELVRWIFLEWRYATKPRGRPAAPLEDASDPAPGPTKEDGRKKCCCALM